MACLIYGACVQWEKGVIEIGCASKGSVLLLGPAPFPGPSGHPGPWESVPAPPRASLTWGEPGRRGKPKSSGNTGLGVGTFHFRLATVCALHKPHRCSCGMSGGIERLS